MPKRSIVVCCFFFQAEDGIRDLVRSRGLGDVYKRQVCAWESAHGAGVPPEVMLLGGPQNPAKVLEQDEFPPPRRHLSLIHI